MFFEVIPTEVFRADGGVLTYACDQKLTPGQIVVVPLGRKSVLGIVYRQVSGVKFPTKPIVRILPLPPLPKHILRAIFWLSDYYLTSIPSVAGLFLPAGLLARGALTPASLRASSSFEVRGTLSSSKEASLLSDVALESSSKLGFPLASVVDSDPRPPEESSSKTSKENEAPPTGTRRSSFSGTSGAYERGRDARHPRRRADATSFPEKSYNWSTAGDCVVALNPAQKQALEALSAAPEATRLLRGVTGSGKTNIYLKMASTTLTGGKSTILLVPEIALTSQLVQIFRQTFGNRVILIHSQQTMAERRRIWLEILMASAGNRTGSSSEVFATNGERAKRGAPVTNLTGARAKTRACSGSSEATPQNLSGAKMGHDEAASEKSWDWSPARESKPLIIIGPRSALLTPVANLGLIIIDESHEPTYYQENAPRYSALRLASFMAATLKIPCLQGSATPNIVDYHLARTRNSLVELDVKAKATAVTPDVQIIDLCERQNFNRNRYFSDQLIESIKHNLETGHQTLIFHNRRGSSPLTICENCGWQALCPNCFLPLTLHADAYQLTCHICGHSANVPSSCPECAEAGVIHKGYGTKLLESELSQLFPEAKIGRFDGDNSKNDNLAKLYQEVKSGEIQILLGTQTLARGLDLPKLATVGIVQADAGLALPDFAAEERTFELLCQVVGRVGRGHLSHASVIVQTFQPNHPAILAALEGDFPKFADYLLRQRHRQQLPPFTYLARLAITYKTEKTTLAKIKQAHAELAKHANISVSPPLPAFHERTARGFTWQLTLKSTSRNALREALKPFVKYHIELDPPSLL